MNTYVEQINVLTNLQVIVALRTRIDWLQRKDYDAVGINDLAVQCKKSDGPSEFLLLSSINMFKIQFI